MASLTYRHVGKVKVCVLGLDSHCMRKYMVKEEENR